MYCDHRGRHPGGSGSDTLKIDAIGGWTATTPNPTLGPTGVAAGISVSGMKSRVQRGRAQLRTLFEVYGSLALGTTESASDAA